jgi:hypothetical protein
MLFDEVSHTYSKDGIVYTSVSEFLNTLDPEFPKERIAAATAKRDGGSADEIIGKWDLNSEISSTYGTAVHKAIEYWIRYGEVTKVPHLADAVKAFSKLHSREKLHAEVIVYSDEYQLAGTIDQLISIGPKQVLVQDVKTNVELTDKKLKKYARQLSTYKLLLEMKGITVAGLNILHWNGDTFKNIKVKPINIQPLLEQWKTKKKCS